MLARLARLIRPSRRVWLAAVGVPTLLLPAVLTGCSGGGEGASGTVVEVKAGQIVRSSDADLALNDPGAVQAFDTAGRFLTDWLFLQDTTRASQHLSPDLRAGLESLLNETQVDEGCVLRQVQGEPLDAQGMTVARYLIEGCQITPPEQDPADAIDITVTVSDQGAVVTGVQFLH